MHHAAARNLQPFLAHFAGQRAGKIDFKTSARCRKNNAAENESWFRRQQFLEDKFNGSLQVPHSHPAVHIKSFDLVESGMCVASGLSLR